MNVNIYYADAIKEMVRINTINNAFNFSENAQEKLNTLFCSDKIIIETIDTKLIVKMDMDPNKMDPFHYNSKDLLNYIVENNIFFEDVVSGGFICHNDFGTFKITAK